jgi:hypothetical protein
VTSWCPGAAHLFVVPRRYRQLLAILLCSQPPGAQVLVWVLDQYLRTRRAGQPINAAVVTATRQQFGWVGEAGRMRTRWVIFTALRRSTDSAAPARMGANARICVVLSPSVARSASIASMPCAAAQRLVQICCALPTEAQQAAMMSSEQRQGGIAIY